MSSVPSRRAFLSASAGALAAAAGCTDVTDPADGDRATVTPRDPRALDVSGAWPQRGFDPGHSGVTTAAGVPTDGDAYWHLRRVRSRSPVLAGGRLYHYGLAGADENGTPTRTQTPPTGTSQPLDGRPVLFCRDARTGEVLWLRELPFRGSRPAVAGDRVLVGGEGALLALRAGDGGTEWRVPLDGRSTGTSTVADGVAVTTIETTGEHDDADVRAYRTVDGELLWSVPSPLSGADLAVAGDTVLALSFEFQDRSLLLARSLVDGGERWRTELDADLPTGPIVRGTTAYVLTDEGLLAFGVTDGSQRWRREGNRLHGVAAASDVAFATMDGRLRALSATDGSERWSASPSGDAAYVGTPAAGHEAVYLGTDGLPADFVALSRADGSRRWSYELPERVIEGDIVASGLESRSVVGEGAVYAYAAAGLYAFGPA